MKLEGITNGASLEGVEPSTVVTVVAAIAIPPDSLQLVYRLPDGTLRERLLSRDPLMLSMSDLILEQNENLRSYPESKKQLDMFGDGT